MTLHLSSRRVRRALAAPALALALLGVTSCGDDATPVAADTGSSLEPGDEISAADLADLVDEAVKQGKKAGTAHVSLTAGDEGGLSGEGVLDYAGETVDAALTVDSEMLGGEAELRMVDGVMYLKVPLLGDQFFKADLDDPNNPVGQMLGSKLDVGSMFEGFEKGVTKATYVGEDDVDGESLDHYAVEVDPAKLVDKEAGDHLEQMGAGKTLSFDLWFDEDGFARQLSFDVPASIGTVELALSEWGAPVSVEAPPADQVSPLPSFG